jgi:hypothetical protein
MTAMPEIEGVELCVYNFVVASIIILAFFVESMNEQHP